MKSPNPNSGFREVEVSRTVDSSTKDPSCNQGGIVVVTIWNARHNCEAIGIGRDAYTSGKNAKFGMSLEEELQPPLTSKEPGAVAKYTVRRLTPLECERLQGYPDYWTDIGDYTDDKGKVRHTRDSARYKALGNSIALPPWTFVLSRLMRHTGTDNTLASLFDGIGGFPLIWQRLGGVTLWTSEIEPFPIAVTKKRLGIKHDTFRKRD